MKTRFTLMLLFNLVMGARSQVTPEQQSPEAGESVAFVQLVDTTKIDDFFLDYPLFSKYHPDVRTRYTANPAFIWFSDKGIIEFAGVLYNQAANMSDEGLTVDLPYKTEFDEIVYSNTEPEQKSELLLSCLYFFYTDRVFKGIDSSKSKQSNWYIPRENKSYGHLLDSLIKKPKMSIDGKMALFSQYYNLRIALKKYRKIEKEGGWASINPLAGKKALKPGDSSIVVQQVRRRLFAEGHLNRNSGKPVFDEELSQAIASYNLRYNKEKDNRITNNFITALNIPVADRIKTIIVNMERCRWISPAIADAPAFIAVNIPSFRVLYMRKGKPAFTSKVVVGSDINKTVVFSGNLSYVVFSPYWNVPESILENEIQPAIQKNPNYLSEHNMEWYNGKVRQKPGLQNSLGLVKFLFPNSNNIYLHDTPAKSLFAKEDRAFSHGCIRVEKARDLAVEIMTEDAGWTEKQVDAKMRSGVETWYTLKTPIPVYIGYFTAWADQDGNVAFYNDVYNRDEKLLEMLHN